MFFKYYSKAGYAIFMFMTSCFFLVGKVPAQAESDFPINTVLIKEEVLKLNPSLNILKWPKDERIRRLEVKVKDIDLIKLIAREKIEKIIKQEYIPSDICDRFIPLRNYIKGCDALLVRYKCREFLIQLIITSANARIVIREEKSSIRETDQGKLRFVQEVMEKFFNEDDILLKTDYGPVARNGGLEGKIPKQTPKTAEAEIRLRWYDTLYWWTDGEIACFWVCFSSGSSGGCVDQKNWFANVLSREKGLRTKRGKLTQEMIDKVLGVKSGLKGYVPVGFCAEGRADVNEVFKIGDHREIEVAVPKDRFIGAPPSPTALPEGIRGTPEWDKDFRKQYVRITVLEKRKLKEGVRVVLRLDEIDANGAVVMDNSRRGPSRPRQGLYYACLDVRSSGCRIVGRTEPVEKDKWGNEPDFGNGVLNRVQRYGLPFPLMLTCPPALSPDKTLKESSWMRGDNGVVYTESTKVVDGRRVCAALLRKVYPSMEVKPQDVRYYSDKDKTLSSKQKTDSTQVVISAQEIQMWRRSTDWLWQTMERTDGKGHITMRCKQIRGE